MSWGYKIAKRAVKQMKRLPKKDAAFIYAGLAGITEDPYLGDVKKIKDVDHAWRRRVGNYRIFYEIYPKEKFISIYNIERRTSKTYR